MRLLLLLIVIGVGAYFTWPTREAHEQAGRAALEAPSDPAEEVGGLTLDDVVGYVKGMVAGEGRYDTYYLFSRYTVDMPGAAYLECYGAFTLVHCSEVAPGPAS